MFSVSHIMAFLMSILLRTVVSFCYLTSANALMQYFMKKIPFFSPHQSGYTQIYKGITEELTSTAAAAQARRGPKWVDIKQEPKT